MLGEGIEWSGIKRCTNLLQKPPETHAKNPVDDEVSTSFFVYCTTGKKKYFRRKGGRAPENLRSCINV
jgi:hypothetical protein